MSESIFVAILSGLHIANTLASVGVYRWLGMCGVVAYAVLTSAAVLWALKAGVVR